MIRKPTLSPPGGTIPTPAEPTPEARASNAAAEMTAGLKRYGDNYEVRTKDGPVLIPVNTTEPRSVRGDFVIKTREQLLSLQGVTEIAGNLRIAATNLTDDDLSLLSTLESVSGNVSIENAVRLTSLAGLDQLQSVGGKVGLSNLDSLGSLGGMSSLRSIAGALSVTGCASLESLSGLDSLDTVGGLSVAGNAALQHLGGLAQTTFDGPVRLERNPRVRRDIVERFVEQLQKRGFEHAFKSDVGISFSGLTRRRVDGTDPIQPVGKIAPKDIPAAKLNLFIHLNADNNLDPYGVKDINELEKTGSVPGMLNCFALIDTYGSGKPADWPKTAKLVYLEKDPTASDKIVSREVDVDPECPLGKLMAANGGELNMGDPAVHDALEAYVASTFPAQVTISDDWNHGAGVPGYSNDDHPKDLIGIANGEMAKAHATACSPVISFDACLMATIEVAMTAASLGAKAFGASEELEPGDGWDYTRVVDELLKVAQQESFTPYDVSKAIARAYTGATNRSTFSATDLAGIGELTAAWDTFSDTLSRGGGLNNNPTIKNCYKSALRFTNEHIDLGDFALRLTKAFPDGELKTAAQGMIDALKKWSFPVTGNPNSKFASAMGLTAYGPNARVSMDYQAPGAVWAQSKWLPFVKTVADKADPAFQPPPWAVPLPPPPPAPAPTPAPKAQV